MSQQQFNAAAKDSILFAQFKAESCGVSKTQIALWLASLGK